jgi:hypothetical protein
MWKISNAKRPKFQIKLQTECALFALADEYSGFETYLAFGRLAFVISANGGLTTSTGAPRRFRTRRTA